MVWSATLPCSSPTSLGHGQTVMGEGFHKYRSRPWPRVISLKSQTMWIHGRHCQGCGFPRARQCGYGSFLAFHVVLVGQGQSPMCSEAAFAVLWPIWHIWYMTSCTMIITWHKHDINMTRSHLRPAGTGQDYIYGTPPPLTVSRSEEWLKGNLRPVESGTLTEPAAADPRCGGWAFNGN